MNIYLLLVLSTAVAAANAAEVRSGVDSSEKKSPGSYRKLFLDGSSFVVEDFVEAGNLKFYGQDDEEQEEGVEEKDEAADAAEELEFIHNIFETSKEAKYIENFEEVLFDTMTTQDVDSDHRGLILKLPHVHCKCPSESKYFNIEIKVTPSSDAPLHRCNRRKQRVLGNFINSMLLDLGVGDAGAGDDVVFLAKVCNIPSEARRLQLDGGDEEPSADEMDTEMDMLEEEPDTQEERELLSNRMRQSGFMYTGGGPCRGCPDDNKDRRKLLGGMLGSSSMACDFVSGTCTQSRVEQNCNDAGDDCNIVESYCPSYNMNDSCGCNLDFWDFLADLNDRIKQYMKDKVVPKNFKCCGRTPGISVMSRAVVGSDVNYGCRATT